jgi:hypothetical protein
MNVHSHRRRECGAKMTGLESRDCGDRARWTLSNGGAASGYTSARAFLDEKPYPDASMNGL